MSEEQTEQAREVAVRVGRRALEILAQERISREAQAQVDKMWAEREAWVKIKQERLDQEQRDRKGR